MVLKELILNSFYFGGGLVLKELIFTTLGGCDGLERTEFEQFLLWEGVVVLEGTEFLQSIYFGRVCWS